MHTRHRHITASCRCGQVVLEAKGRPILSAACYCASCQEAGRRIASLPDAPPVPDADGGTAFLLYRKDRLRFRTGGERLKEYRLKPESPTRRVVATCCNSAMFLEFSKGHWLSLYRDRFLEAPALEMRVMTSDRPAGVELPGDIPNYEKHSVGFMWKLLSAWIAMGLHTPKSIEGAS